MIFWLDKPLEQWIYVTKEKHHKHPWSVMVGGSVRARCTREGEAKILVERMKAAIGSDDLMIPQRLIYPGGGQ